jgi:hypothetical protein
MAQSITAHGGGATKASFGTTTRTTRALLACGVVAGPLFAVTGIVQMLTRPGFDIRRYPLSILSNGDLGWIQITNFEVTGILYLAFAIGMWRALHPGRAGTWGPLLVGVYGLGMIGAGMFTLDPGNGFPPGTPPGPGTLSWHGVIHLVVSSVAFYAMIATCFVHARRFAGLGQSGWAACSVAAGVYFFLGIVGSLVTGGRPWFFLVNFGLSVLIVLMWATALAARLRTELTGSTD